MEKEWLEQFKELLARFPGTIPIYLRLELPQQPSTRMRLSEDFKVEPCQELLEELDKLLSEDAVVIKRQPPKPAPAYQPRFSAASPRLNV